MIISILFSVVLLLPATALADDGSGTTDVYIIRENPNVVYQSNIDQTPKAMPKTGDSVVYLFGLGMVCIMSTISGCYLVYRSDRYA